MKKNRRKRKTVFSVFTHKRQVVLKYQLKGEPQLKISQYPHEKHENICVRVSLE